MSHRGGSPSFLRESSRRVSLHGAYLADLHRSRRSHLRRGCCTFLLLQHSLESDKEDFHILSLKLNWLDISGIYTEILRDCQLMPSHCRGVVLQGCNQTYSSKQQNLKGIIVRSVCSLHGSCMSYLRAFVHGRYKTREKAAPMTDKCLGYHQPNMSCKIKGSIIFGNDRSFSLAVTMGVRTTIQVITVHGH